MPAVYRFPATVTLELGVLPLPAPLSLALCCLSLHVARGVWYPPPVCIVWCVVVAHSVSATVHVAIIACYSQVTNSLLLYCCAQPGA